MKMINLGAAVVLALGIMGTGAFAASISPTSASVGSLDGGSARGAVADAFDGNSSSFFEFEYGEVVEFYFAPDFFTSPGSVIEITNGGDAGRANWDEYITVEVGIQGDNSSFVSALPTVIQNIAGTIAFTFDGIFNTLRVTDVTVLNADFSTNSQAFRGAGFDLAEISVTAVPLPASALFLLGGLGGLVAMRRRK